MKKSLSVFVIMLFLCVSCILAQNKISQDKPDLSGTWILDKKESPRYFKNVEDYTLEISHTGEQIKITKNYKNNGATVNYTLILFTDKRGEKNVVPLGDKPTEIESKTYWNKDELYRDYSYFQTFASIRNNMYYRRNIEKYKLSEDGKKLTVIFENRSSTQVSGNENPRLRLNVPNPTKLVFRKAEG